MSKPTPTPPSSFYYRNPQGSYGFAHYIKRRRVYRLVHLTPAGDVPGSEVSPEWMAWTKLRKLKNRPSRASVREQGW